MDRKVYCLKMDGRIVPDTHLFVLSHPHSAIYAYLSLSNAILSSDIELYCVGSCDEFGNIMSVPSSKICDFNNCVDIFMDLPDVDLPNIPKLKDIQSLKYNLVYSLMRRDFVEKSIKDPSHPSKFAVSNFEDHHSSILSDAHQTEIME